MRKSSRTKRIIRGHVCFLSEKRPSLDSHNLFATPHEILSTSLDLGADLLKKTRVLSGIVARRIGSQIRGIRIFGSGQNCSQQGRKVEVVLGAEI